MHGILDNHKSILSPVHVSIKPRIKLQTQHRVYYSDFEVTCPDCDLQSALDHAARDK